MKTALQSSLSEFQLTNCPARQLRQRSPDPALVSTVILRQAIDWTFARLHKIHIRSAELCSLTFFPS
jgi:hypothetical protein